MIYNIFNCDGQNSGFFILALAKTSYLYYHSIWPRLNRTASAVASIRKTVDRGYSFLNAKTDTPMSWRSGAGSQKRIAMKVYCATLHIIPNLKAWCQLYFPTLSQLNPTLESPGNFTSASDSPASIFPLFPQQYRPCEFSLPIPWQAWAASIFGSIGVQSHIPFLDSVANDRRLWLDAYTTLKPGEVKGSVSRHLYGQCDGAGGLFAGGAA